MNPRLVPAPGGFAVDSPRPPPGGMRAMPAQMASQLLASIRARGDPPECAALVAHLAASP